MSLFHEQVQSTHSEQGQLTRGLSSIVHSIGYHRGTRIGRLGLNESVTTNECEMVIVLNLIAIRSCDPVQSSRNLRMGWWWIGIV